MRKVLLILGTHWMPSQNRAQWRQWNWLRVMSLFEKVVRFQQRAGPLMNGIPLPKQTAKSVWPKQLTRLLFNISYILPQINWQLAPADFHQFQLSTWTRICLGIQWVPWLKQGLPQCRLSLTLASYHQEVVRRGDTGGPTDEPHPFIQGSESGLG